MGCFETNCLNPLSYVSKIIEFDVMESIVGTTIALSNSMERPKTTSLYSATKIGAPEQLHYYRNDTMRQQFRDEAKVISSYMKGIHFSQKLPHMQVNYSNTVRTLTESLSNQSQSRPETNSPRISSRPSSTLGTRNYNQSSFERTLRPNTAKYQKELEFREYMTRKVKEECFLNERKRLYLKNKSNKSEADDIVKGIAPMPKQCLYPQNATYEQILGINGGRKSVDPNIIPPEVPKPKKWLGYSIGWES